MAQTLLKTHKKHTNVPLLLPHTHATSSVTGLFSSLVFRVYSRSCVCDPGRCSRSNVRLPFHLRARMCARVCESHCLWVRQTQPDPRRQRHVYTFWSVSPWVPAVLFLLPPGTCLPHPLRNPPISFFLSTPPLLFFHLLINTSLVISTLWISPPLGMLEDKHWQYL